MLTKFGKYFAFICRRERVLSPIWLVSIAGLSTLFAALYPNLLPTQTEAVQMAAIMSNPAMVAMMGNVYGMESLSQASMMAQQCLIWFLITAAIMNLFLVNRHTRVDEEVGRLEMFRAMPVGRLTGSLAVMAFAFLLNLAISVLTAVLLLGLHIGGTTAAGAFSYGFSIGAVGFLFAALTLLAAQLFSSAQGVSGFGFAALILFYIMRAGGDVFGNALSFVSPLGLGLKTEAFYLNAVWPSLILLFEGVVLGAAALAVHAVRDHGAGVIPAKKGRAHASRFLQSPIGYAWRISRGNALGWSAGMLMLGASYGSVCGELDAFVAQNEMVKNLLAQSGGNLLLDNYIATIFSLMSMVASVPAILSSMRIHSEEKHGRLEQVLARSVPRQKLYGGFLIVAATESVAMEFLLAAGLSLTSGGELALSELLKAGFCYLPAIWLMAGLAVLLVGFFPKAAALIWAVFGYTFLVMYVGRIFEVPQWAMRLSPFGNIPQLPVQELSAEPLVALTALSVACVALGVWKFKRRDIG